MKNEEIAVAQERARWIPVTERLPEVWSNDLSWSVGYPTPAYMATL